MSSRMNPNGSSESPTGGSGGSTKNIISSKTGFLTKRAMSSMDAFANWKQRFFVLSDGTISYYKQGGGGLFASSKDDIAHLKGEIVLTKDTIVRKSRIDDKVNCFEVITPSKKLYAQADTTVEMQEWITAIQSHIQEKISPSSLDNSRRRSFNSSNSPSNSFNGDNKLNTSPNQSSSSLPPQDWNTLDVDSTSDLKTLRNWVENLRSENARLRECLALRENELLMLEKEGVVVEETTTQEKKKHATVLDLRDVRKKQFQLWDAAEEGDLVATRRLLSEAVVDINGKGIDQWTALHLAVASDNLHVAQLLLSRGAFVNSRTRERLTPLHIACRKGHNSCVALLISNGADVTLTDQSGNSCLHAAAEGGHISVVQTLFNEPRVLSSLRPDVLNASGSLPMHLAPIGHPIRVLLAEGGKSAVVKKPGKEDPSTNRTYSNVNATFRNKFTEALAVGPRDFEFIRVLGRGAFAKVYLVRGKGSTSSRFYALKAYNKHAIVQKNQSRYIHTEKAALQACSDHPFIVTLHYAFQTDDRLCLVMDYCGGGDLLSALTRKRSFTEDETAFYIAQITLALSHLHSKNIVFRDLKPENVVMDLDGNCLLTDFGISKEGVNSDVHATTFCGSPMYLAPEMLSRSGHGPSLDWYSVGALTYELLTGLPPYYTNDKKQLFQNILKGNLPLPDYISREAKDLLQNLLHRDPSKRLGTTGGVESIKAHPFFRKIDWVALLDQRLTPPIRPVVKESSSSDDVPDVSNFPQAFTDQAISDSERGLVSGGDDSSNSRHSSRKSKFNSNSAEERRLFKDFDFQPAVSNLSSEAHAFEQMAIAEEDEEDNLSEHEL